MADKRTETYEIYNCARLKQHLQKDLDTWLAASMEHFQQNNNESTLNMWRQMEGGHQMLRSMWTRQWMTVRLNQLAPNIVPAWPKDLKAGDMVVVNSPDWPSWHGSLGKVEQVRDLDACVRMISDASLSYIVQDRLIKLDPQSAGVSEERATQLLETLADLAQDFGAARVRQDESIELDSRALNRMLIEWAREFEQSTKDVRWNEDPDRDYIIDVDTFFDRKYGEWMAQIKPEPEPAKFNPAERLEICKSVAAYYTRKFKGQVRCSWQNDRRYVIQGSHLPPHPDLKDQYPNGWTMIDAVEPEEAYRIHLAEQQRKEQA